MPPFPRLIEAPSGNWVDLDLNRMEMPFLYDSEGDIDTSIILIAIGVLVVLVLVLLLRDRSSETSEDEECVIEYGDRWTPILVVMQDNANMPRTYTYARMGGEHGDPERPVLVSSDEKPPAQIIQ